MWGGEGLWKTPGINLWFHIYGHPYGHAYTHACMPHINPRALESKYAQNVLVITSLMMSSYGTSLLNVITRGKTLIMMPDCKPSGVWGQTIQTHSSFVSDLQVAKSENREGGDGHLESSHYLIIWIKQREPRRKENSRNTDVCKEVPGVS